MRPILVALAASPALIAAGCDGSQSSEPVATTEVAMAKSYRFDPKTIEIEAGQNVTWTNEDNFTHTVQVDGQEDHKVERGESVSIAFDTRGTYHYVCTLHPQDMDGEVIVK
jgi:plastocyanin